LVREIDPLFDPMDTNRQIAKKLRPEDRLVCPENSCRSTNIRIIANIGRDNPIILKQCKSCKTVFA
jgi:hypothetical protein